MILSLLEGRLERLTALPDGQLVRDQAVPPACLPGSFNPLHDGHLELAAAASAILGCPVSFELSVENVDKPALTVGEIAARLHQFTGLGSVELTRAPTFPEKSGVLPGATFVVGADTAERLLEPRYYGNHAAAMAEALEQMWSRGNRFLVAGRRDAAGRFRVFDPASVPAPWRPFFTSIPEERFRIDLSSTELRQD